MRLGSPGRSTGGKWTLSQSRGRHGAFSAVDKDAQGANGHLLSAHTFPKTKKAKIKIKKSKKSKKGFLAMEA